MNDLHDCTAFEFPLIILLVVCIHHFIYKTWTWTTIMKTEFNPTDFVIKTRKFFQFPQLIDSRFFQWFIDVYKCWMHLLFNITRTNWILSVCRTLSTLSSFFSCSDPVGSHKFRVGWRQRSGLKLFLNPIDIFIV